ncbi:aldolase [Ramlibacter sp. WS9]|uniref:class II aldolase/adducin family protein n=1 Tax=Ramlibacter sp. WS9 TaxID=1882741 RepID=UPI001143FC1C|nr:aldolase [Ramlibacter sp. WS9]ROZ64459.1 aldolase [Ramlibacter sp. WS9]
MNESQAREEICRIGKSLFDRGYVHAAAGNISARLDDGFLITPTDAPLGFLDPAQLAKVDLAGRQVSGAMASKTLALHSAIYRAALPFDGGTRCIVHTHSAHSVALSLRCEEPELLPPITPYFVMKVGHVPVLRYQRPGAPATAEEVAGTITRYGEAGRPIRAVMLQRLGPNVWHDTPAAAMAVLEELEETARLMLLAQGPCSALTEPQIDELRRSFNARW